MSLEIQNAQLQARMGTATPTAQPFIGGLIKKGLKVLGRTIFDGGRRRGPTSLPGGVPIPGVQDVPQQRTTFKCPPGTIPTPTGRCINLPGGPTRGPPLVPPQPVQEGPAPGMKLACPSGMHPNKSDYFLKDGTFVAKGTRCVKNRRRNPLNPRALDRAISRIQSAKKASKKISRVTVRKKKKC